MSDPVHAIIQALKPLLSNPSTIYTRTTLSTLRTILGSDATAEIFAYLCTHGAATAWVLQRELNLPETTVYRTLKKLRAVGAIKTIGKIRKIKRSKGGRRVTIWALEGATRNEVVEARRLHHRTPGGGL